MRTYYESEFGNDRVKSYEEEYEYPTQIHRKKRNWKENASIAGLMAVGTGLMIADISIHHMVMASLAFATGIVALLPKEANSLLSNFERMQRKYGINIYTVLFCLVGAVFMLDIAAAPANAQFMQNAEDFFTEYFTGVNEDIIRYVFAVLRGLFLIYLGIGLIRVVQAARNDEDWQTIARTPIIVALTVVVGDLLAGLVTG
ncbi:hypothetical protein CEN49_08885 [Fischerella thermalis CCMEE 5273]|uniref:Uncharacterized protein n=1 Tax=Chlorogloeopsis fritschii PCC 6912 TaxID=211165 RepID=A0A433NLH8_CHLFR|nr:hypothetical protein [Chlorogloeopsis fritschii]PMB08749.1 hypothetical protein CEN49_08885 [Fischerella thermalis CCMEE 5273]PMB43301.1 hypothetical protein CEN40_16105 [Fischerella thermalis CCMEE 5205]RUR83792.1 hypothetical protein PCC6912_20350 [Chlorogloeopsis fritschii PCC 6912]